MELKKLVVTAALSTLASGAQAAEVQERCPNFIKPGICTEIRTEVYRQLCQEAVYTHNEVVQQCQHSKRNLEAFSELLK